MPFWISRSSSWEQEYNLKTLPLPIDSAKISDLEYNLLPPIRRPFLNSAFFSKRPDSCTPLSLKPKEIFQPQRKETRFAKGKSIHGIFKPEKPRQPKEKSLRDLQGYNRAVPLAYQITPQWFWAIPPQEKNSLRKIKPQIIKNFKLACVAWKIRFGDNPKNLWSIRPRTHLKRFPTFQGNQPEIFYRLQAAVFQETSLHPSDFRSVPAAQTHNLRLRARIFPKRSKISDLSRFEAPSAPTTCV